MEEMALVRKPHTSDIALVRSRKNSALIDYRLTTKPTISSTIPMTTSAWIAAKVTFNASQDTNQAMMNKTPSI
jgi:hypothetical protein